MYESTDSFYTVIWGEYRIEVPCDRCQRAWTEGCDCDLPTLVIVEFTPESLVRRSRAVARYGPRHV